MKGLDLIPDSLDTLAGGPIGHKIVDLTAAPGSELVSVGFF